MHVHVELPLQEGDYNQILGQLCWLKHIKCVQPLVKITRLQEWGNAQLCLLGRPKSMSTGGHSKDCIPVLSVSELAFSAGYVISKLFVPLVCLINTSVEVLDVIALVVRPKK